MMMTYIETAGCTNNESLSSSSIRRYSPSRRQPNNKNGLRAWFFILFLTIHKKYIILSTHLKITKAAAAAVKTHSLDFVFETIRLPIHNPYKYISNFFYFYNFTIFVFWKEEYSSRLHPTTNEWASVNQPTNELNLAILVMTLIYANYFLYHFTMGIAIASSMRMPRRQSLSQWTSSSSSTIDVVRLYAHTFRLFHVTVRGCNTQQGKNWGKARQVNYDGILSCTFGSNSIVFLFVFFWNFTVNFFFMHTFHSFFYFQFNPARLFNHSATKGS